MEIPTPSRDRCSASTKPVPPVDCSARPAVPAAGWLAASVAFRPMLGLATPKLAGPIIRMLWRRQISSSSARAGPLSPAAITIRALTPRRPQSSATPSTAAGGTVMTARSTCSGSAAADGRQPMPSSSAAAGLTG